MKSALLVELGPPDVESVYLAAEAAWRAINTKMKTLRNEIERRRLARQFALNGDIPERCKELAATVADLITASNRSPLRAASDIEALEFDLARLQPEHIAAHEAYIAARGAWAAEVAGSFRASHLKATRDIVAAVDALSLALQAERDVRAAFAAASPEPASCLLPDVAADLRQMDLSRWDSTASVWARRIRNFGVTK